MLFLPGTIGSSSASAVLLELVHHGHAPAALVLHEPDAILLLGLIVAREMGWRTPMALQARPRRCMRGFDGSTRRVSRPTDCCHQVDAQTRFRAARGPAGGGRR